MLGTTFNAAIFRGHGTPAFCACQGFLCGARPPEIKPEADARMCLFGLDCVKPGYARIDPRSYDAAVVVMDTCGAGSPDSGISEAGIPPLSILAATAQPLAVVASRHLVRGSESGEAQIAAAFSGALTAGDAVARLNRIRCQASLGGDFYLLGDPELPSQAWDCWADAASASQVGPGEWHAFVERHKAPYVRVVLDTGERAVQQRAWHVWRRGRGVLGPVAVLSDGNLTELCVAAPADKDSYVDLWLATRQRHEVPAGLASAVDKVDTDCAWWRGALAKELPRLQNAAKDLSEHAASIAEPGAVIRASPKVAAARVTRAIDAWCEAQQSCVEAVAENHDHSCWPWDLTGTYSASTAVTLEACPWCGRSPIRTQRYLPMITYPRDLIECSHCEVVSDRPGDSCVAVEIDAPGGIAFPDAANVEVRINNPSSCATVGSLAVFVSGGAPIRSMPTTCVVKLAGGESGCWKVRLEFDAHPEMAKRYGLRVVMLLNDELYWFGRRIVVADETRRDATAWAA
jgi:hypothetical protein